jgi:UDP-N-acetylmuramyl pentapeptide phosphotransferase/UDP-N-acetylglucosamine-1-phosphate transferase
MAMLTLFTSFIISLVLVRIIKLICEKKCVYDVPNQRSSHVKPTPLMGGIGFVTCFLIMALLVPSFSFSSVSQVFFLLSLFGISLLGLFDDIKGLPARFRFLAQIVCSSGIVFSGIQLSTLQFPGSTISLTFISVYLSVFFLVSTINIFNFMDGIDGYAGGVSLIGALSLAILAHSHSDSSFMMLMLLLAAVISGFLVWNFPKASIFMGDVGSTFLGLLFGAASIYVSQVYDGISIVVPIIIFSVFLMDASVTMLGRLCSGKKFWEAHREHFYQKLNRSGWSHRQIITLEFSHMIILCAIALRYSSLSEISQWLVICGVVLSFALKFTWIQKLFKKAVTT